MPPVMPATLPPRARARDALSAADAHARAREALAAAGAGWRRRIRLSLEAQRLRDLRLHPHDLPLFSANQIHLYRVDGRLVGTWPTPRWEWVPAGRGSARDLPPARLDPLLPAFDLPPYRNAPTPPNLHFTHMDINQLSGGKQAGGSPGGYGSSPGASGASGASGAVGAGAAVLALAALVLLARALERCLDQRLFKLLRRRSDEWFTPNVLATSHQVRDDTAESAALDSPNIPPGDPPPPYSMCLPKNQVPGGAEPPPPYSACYVAFGGPEDLPRVHLNVPTSSLFQDTGQAGSERMARPRSEVSEGSQGTAVGDAASDTETPEWRPSRDSVASGGPTVFPNNLVA